MVHYNTVTVVQDLLALSFNPQKMQYLSALLALMLASSAAIASPTPEAKAANPPSQGTCGKYWPLASGETAGRAKEVHIDCFAGAQYSVFMTDYTGCQPADHTHGLISVGVTASDDPGTVLAIIPASYVAAGSIQTGSFMCTAGGIDITVGLDHIDDATWFGLRLRRDD